MRPACTEDGCPYYLEQECQKCHASRCDDHIAKCVNCWQLAKPISLFCYSCANSHQREKTLRLPGNCVDEWMAIVASEEGAAYDYLYPKEFAELQQRRIERYKLRGLL